MRSSILIGAAAFACCAAPAAAQVYTMPANPYTPTQGYVYGFPAVQPNYDRGDWLRECRDTVRDHRWRDERRRECEDWLDRYEHTPTGGYDYRYSDDGYAYGNGYRNGGGYSYGYPGGPAYGGGYRYGGGYGGSYAGGYAGGGGYMSSQSGGVVVIIEEQRGERYVPVIREEIIEETYETTEYETVRERVIEHVPVQSHPRPRGQKYIKYIKGN